MNLKTISEAKVKFLLPEKEEVPEGLMDVPRRSDPVFYNPKQALNRDLSILMLHAIKDLGLSKLERVAETFSGTGIRALRYALQSPKIDNLYINDISPRSIELTKQNFDQHQEEHNIGIHYYNQDANLFFLKLREENVFLDFIDIDPYGTPAPYLHNALMTLERSGVIAVTATDMPVITGLYPEKAYRLYQIPSFKVHNRSYCHEIGLRMLIAYIQREGLFYKQPLQPLLSYFTDHYVRVFMHYDRSFTIDKIIQQHGYVSDCTHCGKRSYYSWKESFKGSNILCSNCGKGVRPLGPLYLGPLHNDHVVDTLDGYLQERSKQELIDRRVRLERLVPMFKEDLKSSVPWFYEIGNIGKKFKFSIPSPAILLDKLLEKGYQASYTHFDGQAIKTNYPLELGVNELFE